MQTRSLKGNLLHQPIQIIKRFNFSIVFNLTMGKQFVNLDKSVVHSLLQYFIQYEYGGYLKLHHCMVLGFIRSKYVPYVE